MPSGDLPRLLDRIEWESDARSASASLIAESRVIAACDHGKLVILEAAEERAVRQAGLETFGNGATARHRHPYAPACR